MQPDFCPNRTDSQDGSTNRVRKATVYEREANDHALAIKPDLVIPMEKYGAGEAIRTPDPNLGKVVLYP